MNILIAPDKFKGTLTAPEAARAIAAGWKAARPGDPLTLLPITDGGDGFGLAFKSLWRARQKTTRTVNAAGISIRARWWWQPKRKTAIIESAAAIGLAQLPPKRFHPIDLDTGGLGKLILAAAAQGARSCFIGIGGSATNDGGFGLARALGWQFLDERGGSIERWTDLRRLVRVVQPRRRKWFRNLIVGVDVRNPLLGRHGATRVYGPQKGLREKDFPVAEACLRRLALIVKRNLGLDLARIPGAGAAGGLGFGLAAYLGARLESGFELFSREADLAAKLRRTDVVITGEGRIDESSMMGKGVGEMARLCRKLAVPCVGLAGEISPGFGSSHGFAQLASLTEIAGAESAKARPAYWLKKASESAAKSLLQKE